MEAEHERQDSQDIGGTRRLHDVAGRPVGVAGSRSATGRLGADMGATRTPVRATPGTVVRMPADVPHALEAIETTRLLLVMLREPKRE